MVAVFVLGDVETFDLAAARARGDHRDLAFERDEGFEDCRLAADIAPGGLEIGAVADGRLALAVVAEAPRLQHRRPAEAIERGGDLLAFVDARERRDADAEI